MNLQERVKAVAISRKSYVEKIEELVYFFGLTTQDAIRAIETYKGIRVAKMPKFQELTFGVEIEAYNVHVNDIKVELASRGVEIYHEGYNHQTRPHFKIVSDASIRGEKPAEIVSPILKGKSGLESLKKVCDVLELTNAKVNKSCGLHIHLDAKNFTINQWRNLIINYARLEQIIDSFMAQSRRGNNNCFCRSLVLMPRLEATILHCNSVEEIARYFSTRYMKINVEAYTRHKTCEFRQHQGTTDFKKISMWLSFLQKLVAYSKENSVENCASIDDVPFLNATEKAYFKSRINQFATA